MHRFLLRLGALSAAVIMGGTAMMATSSADAAVRTAVANQTTTDPGICILINDVWYCFENLEGNQSSSRSLAASS